MEKYEVCVELLKLDANLMQFICVCVCVFLTFKCQQDIIMKRINQDFCKGKISELVLNNIELVTVCGFCYGIFGLYSGRLRLLMLLGVFCFQCYCLALVSRLSRVLNLQFWL